MTSCLHWIYSILADVNIWPHRSSPCCIYAVSLADYLFHCVRCCVYISGHEWELSKWKEKDRLIGSGEKKLEVVKSNESIPVSLQPLWRIIATVFFGGWEMPKRASQTKHLPLLLFDYNISSLTIPRLSPFTGFPPAKGPPEEKHFFFFLIERGTHSGDKRVKCWRYYVPVMLIKANEKRSEMFHRYQTISFCVKRETCNAVLGFCVGHPSSIISFTMKCHFFHEDSRSCVDGFMLGEAFRCFILLPLLVI